MFARFPRPLVPLAALFLLAALPAQAQVSLTQQGGQIVIENAGYESQLLAHMGGGWTVADAGTGEGFVVGSGADGRGNATGGSNETRESTVIIVGGYQGNATGGSNEVRESTVMPIGGYQEIWDHFTVLYGAQVDYDAALGVNLIRLPGFEDPIAAFVQIVTQDSIDGRPIIDYLRMIEVSNMGVFGETAFEPVPASEVGRFPNDRHFGADWGFLAAQFGKAHLHPAKAQRTVRVGLIDSGIRSTERGHPGLDGIDVQHLDITPSADLQVPHALAIATLLGDAGNDGTGSAGLLGSWENIGCYARSSFFYDNAPQLLSLNVGDWGPSTLYLARAIRESIAMGLDVINLSVRTGYSPVVYDAVVAALEAGVVVVAAGGNHDEASVYRPVGFPASIPGVISVAAAGPQGRDVRLSGFSANDGVDIAAPGEGVVLGGPGGIWYVGEGTSYAAGYVTAAAAMMKSVDAGLTSDDVLAALQAGAERYAGGVPFLDAFESLNAVLPPSARGRGGNVARPGSCEADDDSGVSGQGVAHPIRVNFAPPAVAQQYGDAAAFDGYVHDTGASFGDRGDGLSYGWDGDNEDTGATSNAPDAVRATFVLMQAQKKQDRTWEVAVPNGTYEVEILTGDADERKQVNTLSVEGEKVKDEDRKDPYDALSVVVTVEDGRLTITPHGSAKNATLAAVHVTPAADGAAKVGGNAGLARRGGLTDAAPVTADLAADVPAAFALAANYPNPFNPRTQIGFDLPEARHVTLRVYDVMGREVKTLVDAALGAGSHTVAFDGSSLASGTYVYRLAAGDFTAVRTMVLMK